MTPPDRPASVTGPRTKTTKKGTITLLSFDDAAKLLADEGFVATSKSQLKRSVRERQRAHLRDAERALVTPPPPTLRERAPDSPECNVTVAFDCSFAHLMSDKQQRSLGDQIRTSYGVLRSTEHPVVRLVCCGGDIATSLAAAHTRWTNFEVAECSFTEHPSFGGRPVWYLSPDATEVLPEELPADGVVLVVGGLVDGNKHKGATSAQAARLGVEQRKLPFGDIKLKAAPVLTCDTMVSIIGKKVYAGLSWRDAIVQSLPKRKLA